MKNCIAFLTALLPFFVSAQLDVRIDESPKSFSKGNYPAYQIDLPKSRLEKTEKDWMNYIQKGAKGKPALVNGEVVMQNAVSPNISAAPFNVYSTLLETTAGVRLTSWFSQNNDSLFFSNAIGDRNLAVEKYLHDFAVQEYKEIVQNELNDENAKLKKLQGELKDLYNEQDKSNKKSSQLQRSIMRNRDEINVNDNDQANKQAQIDRQKQIVEEQKSNPGPALDAAKKALRGYERDLDKLINKKERLYKQIDNWSAHSNAEDRDSNDAMAGQRKKYAEIDHQKAVIQVVKNRLDAIK